MNKFLNNIDNLISSKFNQNKDKIMGVNLLDQLKYMILENENSLNFDEKVNFDLLENKNLLKKIGDNEIKLAINYNKNPISKINYKIEKDILFIVIKGFLTVAVLNDGNSALNSLNITSKMGIILSKDTFITEKISKESIILEISTINLQSDIEN